MVKVWYEPPPYGPRTSLNRPAYGNGGDIGPRWVVRLSKMAPGKVIAGFVAGFVGLAYIPLSKFYETHNMSFCFLHRFMNRDLMFQILRFCTPYTMYIMKFQSDNSYHIHCHQNILLLNVHTCVITT